MTKNWHSHFVLPSPDEGRAKRGKCEWSDKEKECKKAGDRLSNAGKECRKIEDQTDCNQKKDENDKPQCCFEEHVKNATQPHCKLLAFVNRKHKRRSTECAQHEDAKEACQAEKELAMGEEVGGRVSSLEG